jgi:hypothetical protein
MRIPRLTASAIGTLIAAERNCQIDCTGINVIVSSYAERTEPAADGSVNDASGAVPNTELVAAIAGRVTNWIDKVTLGTSLLLLCLIVVSELVASIN